MNDNNLERKLIGSFIFYDEEYMRRNLSNSNLNKYQGFSRETIEQSAILDNSLQRQSVFYMLVENYIYNILIPDRDGHKIVLKRSNDGEYVIDVYSLNYHEVISNQGILRRVKNRNRG